MSSKKGHQIMDDFNNNILVVGKKGDRNIVAKKGPKPKKQPEPEPEPKPVISQYRSFYYERPPPKYFYDGRMNYNPPPALRLTPYFPWRQAYNAKEEEKKDDEDEDEDEEKPPRLNGKQKSLIKRLNKSPNSAFSKERTLCRNKDVAAKSNKLILV